MTDSTTTKPKVRHLLGLSGGKDSSALAIYMRDKVPEIEYFFSDTGAELPETLQFIDLLEDYLGKPIVRLSAVKDFEWYLKLHNNFLPSPQQRWCTVNLKLKPFEEFVGNDEAVSYVAIRADEPARAGYNSSSKQNINIRFPFREDNIGKSDVQEILANAGLGMPSYYEWRSRSGCYFCFFQRVDEWKGLKEKHPDLFEKAKQFEKTDPKTGKTYTWNQQGDLDEVVSKPRKNTLSCATVPNKKLLLEILGDEEDSDYCVPCHK